MGLDLIREMFANATKWKMNTVRIYAHTTDPEHPFMVINLHCRPCLLTYGLFRAYKAPSLLCSPHSDSSGSLAMHALHGPLFFRWSLYSC